MKVSPTYYDEQFPFRGQWDMESLCGLKIRKVDGKTYVIVTELYQENPGTSVTYAGQSLRDQICEAKDSTLQMSYTLSATPTPTQSSRSMTKNTLRWTSAPTRSTATASSARKR